MMSQDEYGDHSKKNDHGQECVDGKPNLAVNISRSDPSSLSISSTSRHIEVEELLYDRLCMPDQSRLAHDPCYGRVE